MRSHRNMLSWKGLVLMVFHGSYLYTDQQFPLGNCKTFMDIKLHMPQIVPQVSYENTLYRFYILKVMAVSIYFLLAVWRTDLIMLKTAYYWLVKAFKLRRKKIYSVKICSHEFTSKIKLGQKN